MKSLRRIYQFLRRLNLKCSPFLACSRHGMCWTHSAWITFCQYCRKETGTTPHEWATEDVCNDCAKKYFADYMETQ